MKKRNGFVIASAVHLALWGILLVNSVIDLLAVVCFPPMDTDMPLGYLLEKGILFLATIVAGVGVLTASGIIAAKASANFSISVGLFK